MSYISKPIYFFQPVEPVPQVIGKAIDSFNDNEWLPYHNLDDGQILHHYTTSNGLTGILDTKSIWCGLITSFNDPAELSYGKAIIQKKIHETMQYEKKNEIKILLEEIEKSIDQFEPLYDTYVACFCEDGNLLPQWRSYGGSGSGYSLGLEFTSNTKFSHSIEENFESHVILRKIIYQQDKQNSLIEKYFDMIIKSFYELVEGRQTYSQPYIKDQATKLSFLIANICFDMIFSFKNSVFEQEKEWRIIKAFQKEYRPNLIHYKIQSGELIPYIHTYFFNNTAGKQIFPLKAIRFGPKLDEIKTKDTIEQVLKKSAALKHDVSLNPDDIKITSAGYRLRW
jgi:hypothetical protein